MTRLDREGSPQTYARVGGVLYLFIIVAALFGETFVRGSLIVPRDAAATAHNILASETLFRVGLAGEMLTCVCDVALAMILYVLLRPVSRNLALLGAFFRLTFISTSASCWESGGWAISSSAWRRCCHRNSPRGCCSPGSCCRPSSRNWDSACGSSSRV
jgi:hypothetical protein